MPVSFTCNLFLYLFPTNVGAMAMGAAALNDAAAWCLLVLAISLGIHA